MIIKALIRSKNLLKVNGALISLIRTQGTFKEQKVVVEGQTINYLRTGNGNNALLCFPGALGTIWSDFKPQITGLDKNKFTIIAWDPPGYGGSRPPDRIFCPKFYENDADMAYKFMKEIGVNKYSLLGWSDGGISGLILAAKYPKVLQKLVIWGSNSYVTKEDMDAYEKIRDISKWSDKMKAPLIKMYTEAGLQELWNSWCNAIDEIYEHGGDICKNLLKDIQCPTLILHGDKDPMVYPEHPGYLLSEIKDARLYRFPDGKHNIHLKYSEDFNNIVTEFLSQSKL